MSANDKVVLGLIIIGMFLCFVAVLAIVVERYKKAQQDKDADDLADREEIKQKILEMHDYGEFLTKELSGKQNEAILMYEMLLEKEKALMQSAEKTKAKPSLPARQKPKQAVQPSSNPVEEKPIINHNEEIKRLYRQGLTSAEIAKQLGIGKGQVELVYHLFVEKK